MQHSSSNSVETGFEQVLGDDLKPLCRIFHTVQSRIIDQKTGENVQKELQWILIQIMDLVQIICKEKKQKFSLMQKWPPGLTKHPKGHLPSGGKTLN